MIELSKKLDKKVDLPCLKMIAQGRAFELLRADVQEHLSLVKKLGDFEYCRFHALFNDEMDVVYQRADGSIGYHWHQVDKVYDFLLSIGMKPFIELNPMPSLLASGDQSLFFYGMNVTPPKTLDLWYDLILNFTEHLTERYGEDEVGKWFFEVWNEPNLNGFWTGTQQEYYDLYETSAKAIKRVCPEYRVGGPATALCAWVGEFIEYCTGKDVPLDFVTTHLYPQDEYCVYGERKNSPYPIEGDYYIEEVKKVKRTVLESSRPDLKIYYTEFNTLSTDSPENITFLNNTALDRLYGASCLTRYMIETLDESDGVAYWTASDVFEEHQMRHTPFSGTYGIITLLGIKKATANAFELMHRMRGSRFDVSVSDKPRGAGILACEDHGIYRVLLWNCKLPEDKVGSVFSDIVSIPGVDTSEYICETARIAKGRGSAYEEWVKMGTPANLTTFEEAYLRACAEMDYAVVDISGKSECEVKFELQPDEVMYVELHKRSRDVSLYVRDDELEKQLNTANIKG